MPVCVPPDTDIVCPAAHKKRKFATRAPLPLPKIAHASGASSSIANSLTSSEYDIDLERVKARSRREAKCLN